MDSPSKLFNEAVRLEILTRNRLVRQERQRLIEILEAVRDEIALQLLRLPSDYQQWYLPQIQAQVNASLTALQQSLTTSLVAALESSSVAGAALLDKALSAARIVGGGPVISPSITANLKSFHTGRIKDITQRVANAIELQLSQVVLGAHTPQKAISNISGLMDAQPAHRIRTIVQTAIPTLYDTSLQSRLEAHAERIPDLQKRWYKSHKRDPRDSHVHAHMQTVPVIEQFVVGGIKMLHPHDPKAPASEVINCGCTARPYIDRWSKTGRG